MKKHKELVNWKSLKRFETLTSDLKKIHGDKYDYTNSVYLNIKTKMKVWCKGCDDEIEITPSSLLAGSGCTKCWVKNAYESKLEGREKTFITNAQKAHGGKYLYNLVVYEHSQKDVELICTTCRDSFLITPTSVVRGAGCSICGRTKVRIYQQSKLAKARDSFPARAELVHPNKFTYDLVDYKGSFTKVEIGCIECQCTFMIQPSALLTGNSHYKCSGGGGFKPNLPAILYYIRVETRNRVCWKIGITNLTVKERFSRSDLELITIINEVHYENGQDAYDEEQRLMELHSKYKYKGCPMLNTGNTELFTKDVLGLDNDYEG